MRTCRTFFLLSALGCLLACSCRNGQQGRTVRQPVEETVSGPHAVPAEADLLHFWDFLSSADGDAGAPEWAERFSTYVGLLGQVPREQGRKAQEQLFHAVESYQQRHPDSPLYATVLSDMEDTLFSPSSPSRNEDLYEPFVRLAAASRLTPETARYGYQFDARLCGLNPVGKKAADIVFVDRKGREQRLYDIAAGHTLLFFGNFDCSDCADLVRELERNRTIRQLLKKKRLSVLYLYIDQETEQWQEYAAGCPASWICGYDPHYAVRMDLAYHVRSLPCLYLLDWEKKVVLKDTSLGKILSVLSEP